MNATQLRHPATHYKIGAAMHKASSTKKPAEILNQKGQAFLICERIPGKITAPCFIFSDKNGENATKSVYSALKQATVREQLSRLYAEIG